LLRLMMEERFPRIWVPDSENRDLRQLLWHRHRLVQMRTRVMNQLHVVALNEGLRRKKALWRPGQGRCDRNTELNCDQNGGFVTKIRGAWGAVKCFRMMGARDGVEPPTPAFSERRF
jgi:hypothetical protein